jgi:hypothetical protein
MRVGWPFPRPPWPLSRCRAGLRGPRSRVSTRRRVYRALLGFTPPSELLLHADRFAVAEAPGRPASLGIRPYTPPPTYRGCVHSHRCRHRLRPRGATRATCSALVVSHHLDGLLRNRDRELVASRSRSWGSPRFRPPPPPHDRGRETDEAEDFPATQYPSKNPPRRQPYRVTTACCLPAVITGRSSGAPVRRSGPPHPPFDTARASLHGRGITRGTGSKALLHRRVRNVRCRCRPRTPYPSWALSPSKVPSPPHRPPPATQA